MPRAEGALLLALAFLLALALATGGASAHGVHQDRGEARVEAGRVVTIVEVESHGTATVAPALVVRDESGRPLASTTTWEATGATSRPRCRIEHVLGAPTRRLTFQIEPDRGSGLARRLALDVEAQPGAAAQTMILTSGGNAETVDIAVRSAAPPACGPGALDGPERLRSVLALVRVDGDDVRLDVVMPLTLLETWLPLERASADRITAAEQAAARPRILELVAGRTSLHSGGHRLVATDADVTFLGLDDLAADGLPRPADLGALTARVRVSLRHRASRADSIDLAWDLWNGAVLEARAFLVDGPACVKRRLSTYEPGVSLRR
jgi:hypothetical protein